jgi:predicted ATPase/DNA-binding SARP family transcriptional activator
VEVTYDFRLLGPLEALADGTQLELGGPKQRAVLALLLLRMNEVVPRERLIDELWGDTPPPTARETLKVYVGRLRKLFPAAGPVPRLVTRGGGYALELEPGQLDLHRFTSLAEAGSRALTDGDSHGAAALLREGLALWRGTPLADLGAAAFAGTERQRLEGLRLAALEQCMEADLARGLDRELIGELEQLVLEHPFRERFRAQLMLALYRCGRQAAALEQYRRTVKLLLDELGIAPGSELKELERAILEQDPSLLLQRLADPRLPVPPNGLVGREREVAELSALIAEPDRRLVTILGAGGSGKSRLALEVAAGAPTGAYFVDLAALAEPRSVLPAIGRALGLVDSEGALEESLRRLVGDRRLLLLLDNFEHLIDAAPEVASLLASVAGLQVLVTSRTPLRVRAEWRYELGSLETEDAVVLFRERVQAIGADAGAPDAVDELCRRLDLLPLAIELAAARADRMTADGMLVELDRRLDLLGDGAHDLPDRQRTLRRTIDWSYALLHEPARRLFAYLGVFAGGCTVAAAKRVGDAPAAAIDALLDAALVRRDAERILMLETIREYALERLRESGREEQARRSHARYYLELVDETGSSLARAEMVARVAAEEDNIRAALRWSSDAGETDLQLGLVVASARFLLVRGRLHDADAWLRPAVAAAGEAAPAVRASVLSAAAYVAGRLNDPARATELATTAWELCRACGDDRGAAVALSAAMRAAAQAGDPARRDALLEQLDDATRELDDPVLRANTLRALGSIVSRAGDHERGRILAQESLAVARTAELELDVGQALCHLGLIALQANRPAEAREPLEQSLVIAHRLTYREAAAYSLSGLAALAVAEDDVQEAARLLAAADALFADVGTTRLPFIGDLDARTRAAIAESVGETPFADAFAEAAEATSDELVERGLATAHR